MKNKFSFIQGRLLETKNKGILQVYPEDKKSLEKEFVLASKLGFDSIEIFEPEVEENMDHIPSKIDKEFIVNIYKENNLILESCTFDPVLSINSEKSLELICRRYSKLISNFSQTNLSKIILPFVANACFSKNKFSNSFLNYALDNTPSKTLLLIESNLTLEELSDLNIFFKDKNLAFCYDTGNRFSKYLDYKEDITSFGSLVQHVHLKDKSDLNQNCVLGTGNVPFQEIIKTFQSKSCNYSGTYVFECNRGNDPVQNHIIYKKLISGMIKNLL